MEISLRLEAKGIACRVVTEAGSIFATLFVAPVDYEMGNPVRCRKPVDEEMRDVPRAEWPRWRTQIKQTRPSGVKDYPDSNAVSGFRAGST